MLLRDAVRGLLAGGLLTAAAVAVFPHFFGRLFELALPPLAFALLGIVIHALALLWHRVRRRARAQPRPLARRGWVTLAAALVLPLVLFALRAPARNWRVAPQLAVLCIDGGTWRVIDPLIAAGRMPFTAGMRARGVSGVLMSTDPAFTPIVWTTIAAGVEPNAHGITSYYATQDQLVHKRLWEVFAERGHSLGLFRWLVTWPPRPVDGFVIPDILAHDAQSHPPRYNFINQLRMDRKQGGTAGIGSLLAMPWHFLRAGLRMETCLASGVELARALLSDRATTHTALRRLELRLNRDVYCHLLREFEPEFTCFYDNGADVLSHLYWQYFEPGVFPGVDAAGVARHGAAIPDYYALNDQIFGDIASHFRASTCVVVLSDHGSAADTSGGEIVYYPRTEIILEHLGMDDEFYGIALGADTFVLPFEPDPTGASLSRAVATLNGATLTGSGTPVLDARLEGNDRVVLRVHDAFDDMDGRVTLAGDPRRVAEWFTTRTFTGRHEPEGIYLLAGPPFRAGAGPQLELVDVAPTLLHAAGMPLSRELTGRVAAEVFADAFAAAREVRWVESYGRFDPAPRDTTADKQTLEKLRSLGYVR